MIKIMLREVSVTSGSFAFDVDKEKVVVINGKMSTSKIRICSGLLVENRKESNTNHVSTRPFLLQIRTNGCGEEGGVVQCQIRGFAMVAPTNVTPQSCIITDSTLVRIIPSQTNHYIELPLCRPGGYNEEETEGELWDSLILSCHDKSVVDSLALRMSIQLQKKCLIGTTSDAAQNRNRHQRRAERCMSFAKSFVASQHVGANEKRNVASASSSDDNAVTSTSNPRISLLDEGILCVFDEIHGSGKTELVRVVARQKLQCHQVHIVTAGLLFAKYGVLRADYGFQSLIHELILNAAVRGEKVCIILDKLADFLPKQSSPTSVHNPSSPCLHAIGT